MAKIGFYSLRTNLDSFIDMIETAQQERENLKRITLEVNKIAFTPPVVDTAKSQQKRLRSSPSPSPNSAAQNAKKKHKLTSSKPRCLAEEFDSANEVFQYETPTQKFFNKLEEEKRQQQEMVLKKQNELRELEMSCTPSSTGNKRPLCSNCHMPGHNKTMCSLAPCASATICKEIKRHPEEEKHVKTVSSDLKTAKTKLKKLEEDITTKRESLASSLNTYAARVQADLINSNPTKYLQKTIAGEKVPNWLLVTTDIRKLERICEGKIPPRNQIQQLLKQYDENFAVTREQPKTGSIINPVRKLWEQKGISFPGKGILPNSTESDGSAHRKSASTCVSGASATGSCSQFLFSYEPTTLEEEECHLERGLSESLKTCPSSMAKQNVSEPDYGLTLLFEAAQLAGD